MIPATFSLSLRKGRTVFLMLLALLAPQAAAGEGLRHGEGLLWQVERAGAAPSYLFGTFHVSDDRILDLPAPVLQAFKAADSATFEVILDPEQQMLMAQHMILTDGRTLDQIIGAEAFAQAVELAAAYGLPGEALRIFKPWALMVVFAMPPEESMRQAAGKEALDQWMQSEARRQGKKLHGLETVEEQLSRFQNMPEVDQVAALNSVLADPARIDSNFQEMLQLYLARNVSGIHQMMLDQMTEADQGATDYFIDQLIDARNQIMVDRMPDLLAAGNTFIAVGAMHLPGDRGILHLLEQQGYQVKRLY